jgi:cell division septation protein DedD
MFNVTRVAGTIMLIALSVFFVILIAKKKKTKEEVKNG